MTAALIIAEGKTHRAGAFQPLRRLGGLSAVEWTIQVFHMAGTQRVVVVADRSNIELEKLVSHAGGVLLAADPDPAAQMLDNIKLGLRYLKENYRRVFVTPVNVPLFSVETLEKLQTSRRRIVLPTNNGRTGHPVLLASGAFEAVLQYTGEGGLAGALRASGFPPDFVEVEDPGVLSTIEGEETQALLEGHPLREVHPALRLCLARDTIFFGPGPYQLLRHIAETDSLRLACEYMGISYSKGWKMLEKMEDELAMNLVRRSRGGTERGSTTITEKGRALLEAYAAFERDCAKQVDKLFKKHFDGVLDTPQDADGDKTV